MRAELLQFSNWALVVLSFGAGIYSLFRNPKSRTVQLWFLASMAVTVWSIGYILTVTSSTALIARQYLRILYFGASLIPILTFHFVSRFLFKTNSVKPLLIVGYICALIFVVLNCFTEFIISGTRYLQDFGLYEEVNTPWFYFFLIYFLLYSLGSIYLLLTEYFHSGGIHRRQIFFLSLALAIGFLGGISNFVTDLTGIYPYGQYFVWLYPILVTYGIFVDEFKVKIKF